MPTQSNPSASEHLLQFSNQQLNRARLPYNELAEQEILSTLFREPSQWDLIAGDLNESDFYDIRHSHIFKSIKSLAEQGQKFGASEVGHFLANEDTLNIAGGVEYLADLTDSVNALLSDGLQSAVDEVRAKSLLRKIYHESNSICKSIASSSNRNVNEIVGEVEARITKLTQTSNDDISNTHIESHLALLENELEYIKKHGQSRRGIQSGFIGLDHKTNGFLKSALIVIAARPGVGKTALALNFAENLIANPSQQELPDGTPVLFFSMEQPGQELLVRLIASRANVAQERMTRMRLTENENASIESEITRLRTDTYNRRLLIDDRSSLTVTDIRKQARAVERETGKLGLIIVDYIQLMQPTTRVGDDSRSRELAQISAGFKQIARDLDVPVVALSQLNRESAKRSDLRPRLSDLRDSGAIEQDADVVILLHREDIAKDKDVGERDGKAEMIIAKNRHGETGKIDLKFNGKTTRFDTDHSKNQASNQDDPEEQPPSYDDPGF